MALSPPEPPAQWTLLTSPRPWDLLSTWPETPLPGLPYLLPATPLTQSINQRQYHSISEWTPTLRQHPHAHRHLIMTCAAPAAPT